MLAAFARNWKIFGQEDRVRFTFMPVGHLNADF